MSASETLGSHVRGARLGFRWSEQLGCYVRVSGSEGRWLIELVPPKQMPSSMTSDRYYRCWWEPPSLEKELCQILTCSAGSGARAVLRVDRLRQIVVNDDACVLKVS